MFPGYLSIGAGTTVVGGPYYIQPEHDQGVRPKPKPIPAAGTGYYVADGVWTPAGYLKIPGGTTVQIVGFRPDGRPRFYCDGVVTWYPAGTLNPFFGPNPAANDGANPLSPSKPVVIKPNWPYTRPVTVGGKPGQGSVTYNENVFPK